MSFRWIGQDEEKGQVTLYKLNSLFFEKNLENEDFFTIAVLDVETTGLDSDKDEIIELGVLKVKVGKTSGKLYESLHQESYLNEPTKELTKKIQKITNLTMDDLKGQKINYQEIDSLLSDVDFIIAHNASFDRPFIEKVIPCMKDKIWLCSLNQIPWDDYNFPERSLKNLGFYHGFYYDAHRAVNDCIATLTLILNSVPEQTHNYLSLLLAKANERAYFLIARKTEFKNKDFLKENAFIWSNNFNYKIYDEKDLESAQAMLENLADTVYKDKIFNAELIEIEPNEKFKNPNEFTMKKGFDLNITGKYTKDYVLLLENAYEHRQILARRGYVLSKKYSGWYIFINEDEIEAEKTWLVENEVYNVSFGGKILKNSYKKKV